MKWNDEQLKLLMINAQKGNKEDYASLLDICDKILTASLRKKIFNEQHFDDISQDILLALHQSRHTYQASRSFLSWFYAIIHYKIVDYIKLQQKEKNVLNADYIFDIFESKHSKKMDDQLIVQDLFKSLSIQERDLIKWLKLDGYSIKEVSRFLNKNESAVKVSLHRLLKKLRNTSFITFLVFVTINDLIRIYK